MPALRELIVCTVHDCHYYKSFSSMFCYKSWQIGIMMKTLIRVFILLNIYCVSHYVKLFTYKLCCNNPCQSYDADFVNEDIETQKVKVSPKSEIKKKKLLLVVRFESGTFFLQGLGHYTTHLLLDVQKVVQEEKL